ncbi:G-protein coupled receptor GRL101-like [Littorina saxatilis]|uniref:G-protein coupled receptor GRL101-like n=1 Tax=Littorina saxatilis TaxID=31220 RepID=UPI0038B55778
MLSFLTTAETSCVRQTVEILVGGRNVSEADMVATVCKDRVPDVTVHHANVVHVLWTINTHPKDYYEKEGEFFYIPVLGFRLRFSFHEKTTPLLQQLPSGLWNCSVPQWPEFKSHFRCNYDTECAGAEDETDCPYTGHCPPGLVQADGRCYIYDNPRGAISWLEANILCAERYGGYLASFNTRQEWLEVMSAFRLVKSRIKYFVGLRTADAGKHTILVCDYRADCTDSSDEDFCVFDPCNTDQTKCGASKQCVESDEVCDGPVDCADDSDERNCGRERSEIIKTESQAASVTSSWQQRIHGGQTLNLIQIISIKPPCSEDLFQCVEDGYCFDVQFRCNGVQDCPGGQDEAGCADYSCPGMYRCRGSRVCYRADKLCDGFGDCPQQDDELFCDLHCPSNCTCYGLAYTCPRVFPVDQFPHLRYLDAGDSGLTARHVNHSSLLIHLSLARCGLLYLGNLTLPNLRSLDLSGNSLSAVSIDEINRLQNLQKLILADSPLTSILLTAQSSLNLRYLDLSHVQMASLTVRIHLPFLQFLNLSFTGLDDVQGTGFQSLSTLRTIDLRGCPLTHFPRHIFRDLQQLRTVFAGTYRMCCQETLPSGFNPQNCHSPEDAVSACERLLKYDSHSVLVAVLAAVSIIGNALGFVVRVSKRTTSRSQQVFFLSHLCASDFINGIYLAVISVADRLYRGTFVWEDVAWRQSVACKTAGVLFMMSCQVSGLFVFIVTVDHVLSLAFRRTGFTSKPFTLYAVTFVVWVVGLVLAITPLVAARWRHSAETAICIPLMFTQQDNSFLDLLVIPQCTLNVGVMAAQIYIYLKSKTNPLLALKADSEPSEIGNARRFLPVAVCSSLCRMSLLVLAVSLYKGSITSNQVRVAASLLVLPLSSALHPVMYAYGALKERRQAAQNERLLKYLMAKRKARGLHVK